MKVRPGFLEKGDEVAVVSPAFCIDENRLRYAAGVIEEWGYRVRLGRNALKRNGPFAGSDDERLEDLQEMTDDPSVKAIICARGGYGMSRIIDRMDFSSLRKDPKWYAGFSDITVLHSWLNETEGLMSIHGEMPLNFDDPEKTGESFETLRKALSGELNEIRWEGRSFRKKAAEGEVTGGNLTLLWGLTGTKAEPVTDGRILVIEEVGEYIYHIDRMLSSLRLAGKLKNLSALVIGGMNDMKDTKIPWGRSIEETVMDIVGEYDYPVLFGFPAGHVPDNRAFYIGRKASIGYHGKKAVLVFE